MNNIKTYNNFINESITDLMKPKLEDDIRKSLYEYFKDELNANYLPIFKKMDSFKEDNLYLILDYDDHYDLIDTYFNKLIYDKEHIEIIEGELEFAYYPELKLAYDYDGVLNYSWYFDGSYIPKLIDFLIETKLNESLRDKMKPKSDEDIKKAIDKIFFHSYYQSDMKEDVLKAIDIELEKAENSKKRIFDIDMTPHHMKLLKIYVENDFRFDYDTANLETFKRLIQYTLDKVMRKYNLIIKHNIN
jgi:hypothetical protein